MARKKMWAAVDDARRPRAGKAQTTVLLTTQARPAVPSAVLDSPRFRRKKKPPQYVPGQKLEAALRGAAPCGAAVYGRGGCARVADQHHGRRTTRVPRYRTGAQVAVRRRIRPRGKPPPTQPRIVFHCLPLSGASHSGIEVTSPLLIPTPPYRTNARALLSQAKMCAGTSVEAVLQTIQCAPAPPRRFCYTCSLFSYVVRFWHMPALFNYGREGAVRRTNARAAQARAPGRGIVPSAVVSERAADHFVRVSLGPARPTVRAPLCEVSRY